jgi:hypothetical protein
VFQHKSVRDAVETFDFFYFRKCQKRIDFLKTPLTTGAAACDAGLSKETILEKSSSTTRQRVTGVHKSILETESKHRL